MLFDSIWIAAPTPLIPFPYPSATPGFPVALSVALSILNLPLLTPSAPFIPSQVAPTTFHCPAPAP